MRNHRKRTGENKKKRPSFHQAESNERQEEKKSDTQQTHFLSFRFGVSLKVCIAKRKT